MENNVTISTQLSPESLSAIEQIVDKVLKAQQAQQQQAQLLSPAEVCKLFQPAISKVTLHTWTKAGRLKSYSIGGRVFYKHGEVIEAAKEVKRYKN